MADENMIVKYLNGIYGIIKDSKEKDTNEIKAILKSIDSGIKELNINLKNNNSIFDDNTSINGSLDNITPPEILSKPLEKAIIINDIIVKTDKLVKPISEEDKKKIREQIQQSLAENERLRKQVHEAKLQDLARKYPGLQPPQWFEDAETKGMKLPPLPPPPDI